MRARLVAREFRSGDASNVSTFSPTSPLSAIKMLIVLSLLHNLMVCVMDISDAFLQVCQREFVLIQVPEWVRGSQRSRRCDSGVLATWTVLTGSEKCCPTLGRTFWSNLCRTWFREVPGWYHLPTSFWRSLFVNSCG